MVNRKRIGNEYEKKLCDLFAKNKYWCHNFTYGVNGQPCDVICANSKTTWLIDVKHCDGSRFYFSRIEPNQRGCLSYARECGMDWKYLGFAVWSTPEQCFKWIPYKQIEELEAKGHTSFLLYSFPNLEELL